MDTKPRNIRMTDEEWATLERLAREQRKRTGNNWTRADVIRDAITQYEQELARRERRKEQE